MLSELAAELVRALLDAGRLDYEALGSTTWDREELLKAIEADKCYYIRSVTNIKDHEKVDLTIDPPPDLAIEVEVNSSALDKLGIYAALRVPEVWRIGEDASLRMLRRNPTGGYDAVTESTEVPGATVALIEPQLKLLRPVGPHPQSQIARQFREDVARGNS
jgi:Uma2 family endonuclease